MDNNSMYDNDTFWLEIERARMEGVREGRDKAIIELVEALSDETLNFPVFTGYNLKLVLSKLGLHVGREQSKEITLTAEDSGKYRFNKYVRPIIGDKVKILYPSIEKLVDGKVITIVEPYIEKV